jgi:hypothetical protein
MSVVKKSVGRGGESILAGRQTLRGYALAHESANQKLSAIRSFIALAREHLFFLIQKLRNKNMCST